MVRASYETKLYPGWLVVATGFMLMAIPFAAVTTLPSLFTVPVTEELGISRIAFTAHLSLATMTLAFGSLFAGKVLERYNIKGLMTLFNIAVMAGFLGYSFATRLWQFYVISAGLGFCLRFITNVPISILLKNWFGPRLRGKATGLAMAGSGIGAMVLSPVISYLNRSYGWRTSYRLLALLMLVLVLPLVVLTISKSPAEQKLSRLGDGPATDVGREPASEGLSGKKSFTSSIFWLMFATFFLFTVTVTAFNINAAPYLSDLGIAPLQAGGILSVFSLGIIIGKLTLGAISDRLGAKAAAFSGIVCLILGLLLLLATPAALALAPVAAFLIGAGNANPTVVMPLMALDLFGSRDYGTIFGYLNFASSLGASIGPLLGSMLHQYSGTYATAWIVSLVIAALLPIGLHLCYKKIQRIQKS